MGRQRWAGVALQWWAGNPGLGNHPWMPGWPSCVLGVTDAQPQALPRSCKEQLWTTFNAVVSCVGGRVFPLPLLPRRALEEVDNGIPRPPTGFGCSAWT